MVASGSVVEFVKAKDLAFQDMVVTFIRLIGVTSSLPLKADLEPRQFGIRRHLLCPRRRSVQMNYADLSPPRPRR